MLETAVTAEAQSAYAAMILQRSLRRREKRGSKKKTGRATRERGIGLAPRSLVSALQAVFKPKGPSRLTTA